MPLVQRRDALLLSVCLVVACGPGALVRNGRLNEDALAVVERRLPQIRGLAFKKPVVSVAMAPEEIKAFLAQVLAEEYAPGDVERVEAVSVRLGLLPEGTRLRDAVSHLYAEEGAGFYDPRSKRLIIASHGMPSPGFGVRMLGALTGRDFVGEFIVSHELTHALQDQHFGLPTEPEPLMGGDDDRRLARHALVEGDAIFAGMAYLLGRVPDAGAVGRTTEMLRAMPAAMAKDYPDVPLLVRETITFVYDAGATFVARALTDGGFATVDRIYADPPASTEQVMHPERYFDRRDPPISVTVGGTASLERAGFVPAMDGALGEFHVRLLAGRALPASDAARVAAGWGGDRLHALVRGPEIVLVWMTAWDTTEDARDFAATAPTFLPAAHVEQRGARVLAILGPAGPVDLARLAADVWSATPG